MEIELNIEHWHWGCKHSQLKILSYSTLLSQKAILSIISCHFTIHSTSHFLFVSSIH